MKKILTTTITFLLISISATYAQNNLGINTTTPSASAALHIDTASTGPQGILIPRMTQARRDAISTPATGLLIYQTDNTAGFYNYNGTAWVSVVATSSGIVSNLLITNTLPQTKLPYAYSRYTFFFDNINTGFSTSAAAWVNNNAFTVPLGMGGLYQFIVNLNLSNSGFPSPPALYPEIQITSGATIKYYYGVGNSTNLLQGDNTDATSIGTTGNSISISRGSLNAIVPLVQGDIVKVFYRVNLNSTSSIQSITFSTDGTTNLSIVKLK